MPIYNAIYWAASSLLVLVASFTNEKIKRGIQMRKNRPWKQLKSRDVVWVHCSSGEFEYARPVLRLLKTQGEKTLVTFFSPSIAPILQKSNEVDEFSICPWDDPKSLNELIGQVKPKALLLARTDIWPQMLHQCRKANIPIHLFSLTIGETSSKLRGLTRGFYRPLFEGMSSIHCVSKLDQINLNKISPSVNSKVAGDTRYDQVIYRISHARVDTSIFTSNRPIVILGSIWPGDFAVLKNGIQKILHTHKIIIAPHEPNAETLNQFMSTYPNCVKLSEMSPAKEWNIMLIDSVGVLADFYKIADIAFIGGSFTSKVHSVMEALAAGCMTLVGPKHENNREAIEFQKISIGSVPAVQKIDDAEDFYKKVAEFQSDVVFKNKLSQTVESHSGASLLMLQTFEEFQASDSKPRI